jgi:hypothetical protein
MAFHRPDPKWSQALNVLENLKDPNKELPRSQRDLIDKKDLWIEELLGRIKEYQDVFNQIGKFVPAKGPTVYR